MTTRVLLAVLATSACMAVAATPASADSFTGTAAWTTLGTGTGAAVAPGAFSFSGGNLVLRCQQRNDQGIISGPLTADSRMLFTGCSITIGGIAAPVVATTSCPWTLALVNGSYNAATGASTATLSACGGTTLAVPSFGGCAITLAPFTTSVSLRNLNNGVLGPLPANQLRMAQNVTGASWTQNGSCAGLPLSGTDGTYIGSTVFVGIWVVP